MASEDETGRMLILQNCRCASLRPADRPRLDPMRSRWKRDRCPFEVHRKCSAGLRPLVRGRGREREVDHGVRHSVGYSSIAGFAHTFAEAGHTPSSARLAFEASDVALGLANGDFRKLVSRCHPPCESGEPMTLSFPQVGVAFTGSVHRRSAARKFVLTKCDCRRQCRDMDSLAITDLPSRGSRTNDTLEPRR